MNTQAKTSTRAWLYATGIALLVQSLFPSGYMPANLQSGWLVMLCPEGLPTAFVDRVLMGISVMGHMDGHHHHHGSPGGHGTKAADHSATGDCQLGSSLDQPIGVPVAALADFSPTIEPTRPLPEAVLINDRRLHRVRSRAPPFS